MSQKPDKTIVKCFILLLVVTVLFIGLIFPESPTQKEGVFITSVQIGNPGTTYYPTSTGGWSDAPTGYAIGTDNMPVGLSEVPTW